MVTKRALNAAISINAALKQLTVNPAPNQERAISKILDYVYVTGKQAIEALTIALQQKCATREVFHAYLNAQARRGDAPAVERGVAVMQRTGHAPDAPAHAALLEAHSTSKDTKGLLRVFNALRTSGAHANADTYGVLVRHFAQMELAAKPPLINPTTNHEGHISVKRLLDEMEELNITPNLATYNKLLNLCMLNRLPDWLMEFFNHMRAKKVMPDTFTYNITLEGLRLCGKMELFEKVAKEMHANQQWIKPNNHTYTVLYTVSKQLEEQNKESPIRSITNEIMDLETVKPDMINYNFIIHQYAKSQEVEKVKETIGHMTKMGFKPDSTTFNSMLTMFSAHGEGPLLQLFAEMKKTARPTSRTYSILITSLCKTGAPDVALKYLDEMMHEGFTPNEICYIELMDAFGKLGNSNKCLWVYAECERNSLGSSTSVIVRDKLLYYLDKHDPAEYFLQLLDMVRKHRSDYFTQHKLFKKT